MILSLMTSGFCSNKNAITRILVKMTGKDKGLNKLISPYDRKYDEVALEMTGLSKSILSEDGVSIKDGLFDLKKFIFDNCGAQEVNKPLLMGYKIIDFDISFLRDLGLDVGELFKNKILDLYHVVFGLDDIGFFKNKKIILKNHKLQTVCSELDISTDTDGAFDKIKAIEGLYEWLKNNVNK